MNDVSQHLVRHRKEVIPVESLAISFGGCGCVVGSSTLYNNGTWPKSGLL